MPAALSIKGNKYNRLTAIRNTWFRYDGRVVWLFRCQCGSMVLKASCKVVYGTVKSCGCLHRETSIKNGTEAATTHGHSGKNPSPTYLSWRSMFLRHNKKGSIYYGMHICDRWKRFENFLKDMGKRPEGHTLDRKDNEKGYLPQNCQWSTYRQQTKNRKNTVRVMYKGEEWALMDLTRKFKVNHKRVWERIKYRGWSVEDALTKEKQC